MSSPNINFPELVKEVRRQLGLSQEDLARALGVSFASINRWENSKATPSKLAKTQFDVFYKKMYRSGRLDISESQND